jgi:MarR family transcriptional regulator, organic hydroperoxide resistance regulator
MSDPLAARPVAAPGTSQEDPLRLALHICFALQNTSRAFNAVYRNVLRETGLTYPQYLVMLALWEHGDLTVKGLGGLLRLDSGTLSPLLKRLEAAGLVSRERSVSDERSVVVRLTAAGEDMREPARKIPAAIQRAAGIDEDDLHTLGDILGRLTRSLDAAAE